MGTPALVCFPGCSHALLLRFLRRSVLGWSGSGEAKPHPGMLSPGSPAESAHQRGPDTVPAGGLFHLLL